MYGIRRRPAKNLTLISRVLGLGLGFGIRVLVNITALYPMLPLLDHLYLPHYKSTTALLGARPEAFKWAYHIYRVQIRIFS